MNLQWFQHVPFEGLGSIQSWAGQRGHSLAVTRFYAGDPTPGLDTFDWLIVMGGPMGVYDTDELPWLVTEKELLQAAIETGKTVLGICLGAQLIADVLGAPVTRNAHREIGWFPVERKADAAETALGKMLPPVIEAFHWHGETFSIPPGAFHLYASEGCANQAFLAGDRVLGLQFHLETTPESARDLIENCKAEMTGGPYCQNAGEILSVPERFTRINAVMTTILNYLETTTQTE